MILRLDSWCWRKNFVIISLYVDDIILASNDNGMVLDIEKWLFLNLEKKIWMKVHGVKIIKSSKVLLSIWKSSFKVWKWKMLNLLTILSSKDINKSWLCSLNEKRNKRKRLEDIHQWHRSLMYAMTCICAGFLWVLG